jgi:hypothetical protein
MLNKQRLKVQQENAYFLGINQENERVYLRLPSFDCGWYWGCGYISTYSGYKNTEANFSMHTHFKGYIIDKQEIYNSEKQTFVSGEYKHHLNEVLKETVLNDSESWVLSELIETMELLKSMLEFHHIGGTHKTENPLKDLFKDIDKYKQICEVLLPKVFVEIDRILKSEKDNLLIEEYFKNQVKYK